MGGEGSILPHENIILYVSGKLSHASLLKGMSHLLCFLDCLKGTSKNSGGRTFTKSSSCCGSDGSRSLLQSAGTTSSCANFTPSSPSPPPTGNTPQPAEARPRSYSHHAWANSLHPLLMARERGRIRKKHTVKWRPATMCHQEPNQLVWLQLVFHHNNKNSEHEYDS